MSQLPYYQTAIKELSLLETKWKSLLDPMLGNPSLQSTILSNVSLINGTTAVNHRLGRKLQGWRIVRIKAAATIYDNQDSNPHQDLTLILISNAAVVVDLEVF